MPTRDMNRKHVHVTLELITNGQMIGREIITLQVGQCGNQIGRQFWKSIGDEHQISLDGSYTQPSFDHYPGVYYSELSEKKFVPRCVLVDLGNFCVVENSDS